MTIRHLRIFKIVCEEENITKAAKKLYMTQPAVSPAWTSVNSQALIQAARHNLGVTIMPDILVEKECERKELVPLTVAGLYMKNKNYLAYHKDKFLSEPMQGFLKILESV